MKVTQRRSDAFIRHDDRVFDAALGAELGGEWLGRALLVPRHRREQVMLDLIVQAAVEEVDDRMTGDVSCRQHLLAQIVHAV